MTSKRDLLVTRLAIKWKWLTPEQGEDVLFLKRKFGSKLTAEQIIRRRGYLDWEEIDQLTEAATTALGRRARPGADSTEAIEAPSVRPRIQVPIAEESTAPRADETIPPHDDDDSEQETDDFRDEHKTVIAAMPELVKAALARARASSNQTILEMPAVQVEDIDEEPRAEPTIFDQHPAFLDLIEKRVEAKVDSLDDVTQESEAYVARLDPRPVLDPIHLVEQGPDSMPGEPVGNFMLGRGLLGGAGLRAPEKARPPPQVGAVPKAALTIFRDEAGDEFLEGEFGGYSIRRVIARGRTSVVYLALHKESGNEVALKVLQLPPVAAARFFAERGDELLKAARLTVPQVVRILDVGRVGERYYVALQYVDGWTLEELLDAGDRPSYVRIAEIGRDLSAALASAEALEILHLDLRPDHVMISESGEAMLTGYGFAPQRGPKIRGTPEYMAPEQAIGAHDKRSDLYGLGATLFRSVTGKVPPPGLESIDPRVLDPAVPASLAEILTRLLAKRPEDRFQRARDVFEALDQLIFDMEAAGFVEAPPQAPPQLRPLLVKAAIGSLGLVGISLILTIALDATELWSGAEAARSGAFVGMLGLFAASIMISTVALIRRGQIPLPLSSAWLVRLQESCGALGALALVAGFVLAPPAVLNVMVGSIAIVVLTSGVFGTLLRRAIAETRADGGVGRMLAVLGDPILGRWRAVHVPLIACLTLLAAARFAVMAYFASA